MEQTSSADGYTEWFVLFVAVFWFGIVGLMSFAGGWHRLASRFRASSRVEGETFWFASLYIRSGLLPVTYGGCLFVTVSLSGVRLSILYLFRFLHPPLFIPWSDVEAVRPEELWRQTYTAVHVRGFNTRLLFADGVGRKLMEVFSARGSAIFA